MPPSDRPQRAAHVKARDQLAEILEDPDYQNESADEGSDKSSERNGNGRKDGPLAQATPRPSLHSQPIPIINTSDPEAIASRPRRAARDKAMVNIANATEILRPTRAARTKAREAIADIMEAAEHWGEGADESSDESSEPSGNAGEEGPKVKKPRTPVFCLTCNKFFNVEHKKTPEDLANPETSSVTGNAPKASSAAQASSTAPENSDAPETSESGQAANSQQQPAVIEERNGEIEFRVVNNDGERESEIILTGLKCIFQKQLPKMPKDYIARLVYDRTHLSIAIVKKPLEVVGGITYRPFAERKFAEIVFCAISSDQQVKGYGAHLMSHLKDYVKATSPVMHFLTYADNYAIGYFKKQGFTKEITLDKSVWMGYIKDYEGGTIMQCSMVPRIRYLEQGRMLQKQKECVLAKIRAFSKSHVVHRPPAQWRNGVITPIDPMSIPAIRESGWSPAMDELARQPRRGPNYNQLMHLLNDMQNHQSAWPFLQPVNKDEVHDYYDVIKEPMDLGTMESKLDADQYATPEDFVRDAKLVFDNCRRYNNEQTPYAKCANKLEKFMWAQIRAIPEWSHLEG